MLTYTAMPFVIDMAWLLSLWRDGDDSLHVNAFYTMTSVEISGEKGYGEMSNFPKPSDPHSHWSWNKSKNPYLLKDCMIHKKTTTGAP